MPPVGKRGKRAAAAVAEPLAAKATVTAGKRKGNLKQPQRGNRRAQQSGPAKSSKRQKQEPNQEQEEEEEEKEKEEDDDDEEIDLDDEEEDLEGDEKGDDAYGAGNDRTFAFLGKGGCIYAAFGIAKDASQEEIKKQYRRLALQFHPDRHASKTEAEQAKAKERFQQVSLMYTVLSDPRKRREYDRTGRVRNEYLGDIPDLHEYFKTLYENIVTPQKIDEFKEKYRNSEEEKKEVLEAYTALKGDMNKVLNTVPLASVLEGDDERFRKIIQEAIDQGEVQSFAKFTNETEATKKRRLAKAKREESEFLLEQSKKKKTESGWVALAFNKEERLAKMDAFYDNLARKYSGKK